MTWLRTPPKSRRVTWSLSFAILLAPVVVAAHFVVRLLRGDYPWNADSIAIPVFGFGILVFPFSLGILVRGLHCYTPHVFLFTWARRHFLRSLVWTLVAVYPVGLAGVGMFLDGIDGRLYWVSAFYLLHGYALLVLRASIVAYDAPSESR